MQLRKLRETEKRRKEKKAQQDPPSLVLEFPSIYLRKPLSRLSQSKRKKTKRRNLK